jgi:hypothetical protein
MSKVVLLGDQIISERKAISTEVPLNKVCTIEGLISPIELTRAMYESNEILNNEY